MARHVVSVADCRRQGHGLYWNWLDRADNVSSDLWITDRNPPTGRRIRRLDPLFHDPSHVQQQQQQTLPRQRRRHKHQMTSRTDVTVVPATTPRGFYTSRGVPVTSRVALGDITTFLTTSRDNNSTTSSFYNMATKTRRYKDKHPAWSKSYAGGLATSGLMDCPGRMSCIQLEIVEEPHISVIQSYIEPRDVTAQQTIDAMPECCTERQIRIHKRLPTTLSSDFTSRASKTHTEGYSTLTGPRDHKQRAAIGQRGRRRRDVTGRQDGDDSRLPFATMMTPMCDAGSRDDDLAGALNMRRPLPAIHSSSTDRSATLKTPRQNTSQTDDVITRFDDEAPLAVTSDAVADIQHKDEIYRTALESTLQCDDDDEDVDTTLRRHISDLSVTDMAIDQLCDEMSHDQLSHHLQQQQTADDDHDRQYEVDKLLQDDEELLKHSEDENDRSDHQLDIHVSDSENYEQTIDDAEAEYNDLCESDDLCKPRLSTDHDEIQVDWRDDDTKTTSRRRRRDKQHRHKVISVMITTSRDDVITTSHDVTQHDELSTTEGENEHDGRMKEAILKRQQVGKMRQERQAKKCLEKQERLRQEELEKEQKCQRLEQEELQRLERERLEQEQRLKAERELELECEEAERVEAERHAMKEEQRQMELLRYQQEQQDRLRQEMADRLRLLEQQRREEVERRQTGLKDSDRLEVERRRHRELDNERIYHEELRRLREEEEMRLAAEAELNARELQEAAERLEKRQAFNKALHMEAAQLTFGQELTRAFTYSYMQLMHTLGLKASAMKPHESESRLYQT